MNEHCCVSVSVVNVVKGTSNLNGHNCQIDCSHTHPVAIIVHYRTLAQGTDMGKFSDCLLKRFEISIITSQPLFKGYLKKSIRPSGTSKPHGKTSNLSNLEKHAHFLLSCMQERDTWDDVTVIWT